MLLAFRMRSVFVCGWMLLHASHMIVKINTNTFAQLSTDTAFSTVKVLIWVGASKAEKTLRKHFKHQKFTICMQCTPVPTLAAHY